MWHIANCNVMIGKNNSVLSRVKAQAPYIYSVGCPSHLVNRPAFSSYFES